MQDHTPNRHQIREFQPFRHSEVGTVIAILTSREHIENEDRKAFVQYFVDFLRNCLISFTTSPVHHRAY